MNFENKDKRCHRPLAANFVSSVSVPMGKMIALDNELSVFFTVFKCLLFNSCELFGEGGPNCELMNYRKKKNIIPQFL